MPNIITGGSTVAPVSSPWDGLTFRQLQDNVYFLLDEAESSVMPRSIVRRYINLGIIDIARYVDKSQTRQTFSTAVGEYQYPLDSPVMEQGSAVVDSVRLDGAVLPEIDPDLAATLTDSGVPRYWYPWGTHVYLVPVPDRAGLSVEVEYRKSPPLLGGDDDASTLPPDALEAVCIYAAYKMKLKDDEYNTADRYKAMYDEAVMKLTGPRTGFYDY